MHSHRASTKVTFRLLSASPAPLAARSRDGPARLPRRRSDGRPPPKHDLRDRHDHWAHLGPSGDHLLPRPPPAPRLGSAAGGLRQAVCHRPRPPRRLLFQINPEGKVPIVKVEDKWISDSDIITQVIEEKYPELSLATPPNKASMDHLLMVEQFLLLISLGPKLYHMEIALGHYKNWSVPDSLSHVKTYMKSIFLMDSFVDTRSLPHYWMAPKSYRLNHISKVRHPGKLRIFPL
ncbi:glutathione S-transferase DHAR1, mitochondrial-like [Phragmites australis]|uniref:glutathione S-transferase DHAR1, mitochondrial-like n=1 Tax=Phragmites australis TaxID=29695 RepID=UPI002D78B9EB|nr:glutathione S-transferase DHAR1, mitochondrial-like [Phragmites australis]